MTKDWERLSRIIEWAGISTYAFAKEIGVARAENLYRVKKGLNGISVELSERISSRYECINRAWVLTGEGNMLGDEKTMTSSEIPYYNMDIENYMSGPEEAKIAYYMTLEMFRGCSLALRAMSDAMTPEIAPGSIVILKEVNIQSIVFGKIYYIQTPSFSGIRNLRASSKEQNLLAVPCNRNKYDSMEIGKEQVSKVFQVCGVITDKSL